jgi:DNA-binding beta-propeller fold protein YncE
VLLVSLATGEAGPPTGVLTQLSGLDGCVSGDGSGGECADGTGFVGADAVAVSPDGKHVYVAAFGAVAAFARNKLTGVLTQLPGLHGCISNNGSGGTCVDGTVFNPVSIAISRDGKHVYVGSFLSGAVAAFARNKLTGVLTQLPGLDGCVGGPGSGGQCTDAKGLGHVFSVAVSPDGKHVYTASSGSDAVAIFARNTQTGALSQLAGLDGCVSWTGSGGQCAEGRALDEPSSVAVSPDGKHVYAASFWSSAVVIFARDKQTGTLSQLPGPAGCVSETGFDGCGDGRALSATRSVAVSPDGKHVYAASSASGAVAVFGRDKQTGALSQLPGLAGCVSETGSAGECTDGNALKAAANVTVSPDGRHVYVASLLSNAVAVFGRNKQTGALSQLLGLDGCVSEDGVGGCRTGKALVDARWVDVSRDGKHAYVASNGSQAIAIFARD